MSSAPTRSPRRSLPAAWALALVVATLAPLAVPPAAAVGVEWRIETVELIENQTRTFDGSIVVALGGALTIRNATILFVLDKDGGLKLEVRPGGTLVLENATLRPTDATSQFYWNFLVSGRLHARHADIAHLRGDPGLGGLEMNGSDILIEDSSIHDNRYYGVMVHTGAPTIRNTTVSSNAVGIFVTPGTSPRLENVTIRASTGFGLKVNDASPVVRNLTIEGSGGVGVGAIGADLDIKGCRISGPDVGVDAALGTRGDIEACEFLTTGTALRANASPVRMAHCTVLSASVGVNATSSAVVVEANSFLDVRLGVRATGDPGAGEPGQGLSNTFAGSGVGFEIYVPNFFLEGNSYAQGSIGVRVFHTMVLVIALAGGAPASGVRVDIKDALGAPVFAGLADGDGNVTAVLEEYRVLGNGTRLNVTPHDVRFQAGVQSLNTTLNATSDRAESFTLPRAAGPTALGLSTELFLFVAAAFVLAGAAGAISLRAVRRRRKKAIAEPRSGRGHRRGPKSGR